MKHTPHILDCTLRDGSYVIGFQFTCEQVENIVGCLAACGLEWIELGHGQALGSPAKETDLDYAKVARKAASKTKIGMLADARATKLEQLDPLKPYLDFIRIGVNVNKTHEAIPMIHHAKSLGFIVSVQMYRSSALPPPQVLEQAQAIDDLGVDVIYFVDTSGRLLPPQVTEHIQLLKSSLKTPIGFHGHDHLGLALANSLAAIQAGCDWVDATLMGMGRDAGNTQLEALVIALEKMGYPHSIDIKSLMTTAEALIAPLSPEIRGIKVKDLMASRLGMDLYPYELYVRLAAELGCEVWDVVEALRKIPNLIHINVPTLTAVIKELGGNVNQVLKNLGIEEANPYWTKQGIF